MKQLNSAHKAAIRYLIAKDLGDTDMTMDEFCKTMGISDRRTMYDWQAKPVFKAEFERQLKEIKESPDLFAIRAREFALFTLQSNLMRFQKDFVGKTVGREATEVSKEVRQLIDAVLKNTEHVKSVGQSVTVRDLSDDALVAAILKDDIPVEDRTVAELEALIKTSQGEKDV